MTELSISDLAQVGGGTSTAEIPTLDARAPIPTIGVGVMPISIPTYGLGTAPGAGTPDDMPIKTV